MSIKNDPLMTVSQVSIMTTLSSQMVYAEIKARKLTASRLGRKRIVVRRSDVERYLAAWMRPINFSSLSSGRSRFRGATHPAGTLPKTNRAKVGPKTH